MKMELTIEQRFALTRARYECQRMSKHALEKCVVKLLKSRMMQKNGVQETLAASGILFKIDEINDGMPEIISEETFCDILQMTEEDYLPDSLDDIGYEDDDLEDDNMMTF